MDELRSLEKHIHNCDYALLPCPNECFGPIFSLSQNPIRTFHRKDLQSHLAEDCPRRLHTCHHCKETGEYRHIMGSHTHYCPKLEIPCSNAPRCQLLIPREDLQTHLSTDCLHQKVPCTYRQLGCATTPLRKDLEDHEKNYKLHLCSTIEMVLTLKEANDRLISRLYALNGEEIAAYTFKVTGFAAKKRKNEDFTVFNFTHTLGDTRCQLLSMPMVMM